jgi:hypothetical protein
MSFVKDATDPIPSGEAGLQRLFAQDSAVSSPLWETAAIDVEGLSDKYYTNWDPASPRWSSPGQLVVMTEGKPNVQGSATIYCEYDVTFFAADVETSDTEIGVGSVIKVRTPGSKQPTPHLSIAAGSRNLQLGDSTQPSWKAIFPGTQKEDVLKMASPRYFLINSSNVVSGLDQFWYLKLTSDGYCVPCEQDGTLFTSISYGPVDVLLEGEPVTLFSRKSGDHFLRRGCKYLCHQSLPASFVQFMGGTHQTHDWDMLDN